MESDVSDFQATNLDLNYENEIFYMKMKFFIWKWNWQILIMWACKENGGGANSGVGFLEHAWGINILRKFGNLAKVF